MNDVQKEIIQNFVKNATKLQHDAVKVLEITGMDKNQAVVMLAVKTINGMTAQILGLGVLENCVEAAQNLIQAAISVDVAEVKQLLEDME